LRNRKIAGCKFRRQVPIDRYFADFACLDAKLIVELDGGQHAEQVAYDAGRTEALEAAGWTVLRFWNGQVLTNPEGVAMTIRAALELARP
jgi:very-short-patch-repair endonuclease